MSVIDKTSGGGWGGPNQLVASVDVRCGDCADRRPAPAPRLGEVRFTVSPDGTESPIFNRAFRQGRESRKHPDPFSNHVSELTVFDGDPTAGGVPREDGTWAVLKLWSSPPAGWRPGIMTEETSRWLDGEMIAVPRPLDIQCRLCHRSYRYKQGKLYGMARSALREGLTEIFLRPGGQRDRHR
jgi:hypothetical protein